MRIRFTTYLDIPYIEDLEEWTDQQAPHWQPEYQHPRSHILDRFQATIREATKDALYTWVTVEAADDD